MNKMVTALLLIVVSAIGGVLISDWIRKRAEQNKKQVLTLDVSDFGTLRGIKDAQGNDLLKGKSANDGYTIVYELKDGTGAKQKMFNAVSNQATEAIQTERRYKDGGVNVIVTTADLRIINSFYPEGNNRLHVARSFVPLPGKEKMLSAVTVQTYRAAELVRPISPSLAVIRPLIHDPSCWPCPVPPCESLRGTDGQERIVCVNCASNAPILDVQAGDPARPDLTRTGDRRRLAEVCRPPGMGTFPYRSMRLLGRDGRTLNKFLLACTTCLEPPSPDEVTRLPRATFEVHELSRPLGPARWDELSEWLSARNCHYAIRAYLFDEGFSEDSFDVWPISIIDRSEIP